MHNKGMLRFKQLILKEMIFLNKFIKFYIYLVSFIKYFLDCYIKLFIIHRFYLFHSIMSLYTFHMCNWESYCGVICVNREKKYSRAKLFQTLAHWSIYFSIREEILNFLKR
ncbi:hypothetical protein AAZV13_10G041200 [Glycine max]